MPAMSVPVEARTLAAAVESLAGAGESAGAAGDSGTEAAPVLAVSELSEIAGLAELGVGETWAVINAPKATNALTETIAVPGVRGTTVETARRRLADAGLELKVNQLIPSDSALVISQSPAPDSRRRPGASVTVTAVP